MKQPAIAQQQEYIRYVIGSVSKIVRLEMEGDKTRLELLLEEYAAGGSDAATVANNIKLKFAPICQPDPKKPDIYGPMQAIIQAALEAAEKRGRNGIQRVPENEGDDRAERRD